MDECQGEALTPNPSPDARERGFAPVMVVLHWAWLCRTSPPVLPVVSPLPRIGRGAGGEGRPAPDVLPSARMSSGTRECCVLAATGVSRWSAECHL